MNLPGASAEHVDYRKQDGRKERKKVLPEKASVLPVICSPVLERNLCQQLLLKLN